MKLLFTPIYFSIITFSSYLVLQAAFNLQDKKMLSFSGFVIEQVLLFCLLLLLYALTKRKRLALILTTSFYLSFLAATYIKIKSLGNPIYPNDLLLLGDLLRTWHVLLEYLSYMLFVLVVLVGVIWYEIKHKPKEQVCSLVVVATLTVTFGYLVSFQNENTRLFLRDHGIYYKKNVNLVKKGLVNGFLTSFFQASFFLGKPQSPKDYSAQTIKSLIDKYQLNQPIGKPADVENVVILMVESFTDPKDFGWSFSTSPTPNFDIMLEQNFSGSAISPVYGGKSINAEFEIMTGLSNRFTPIETTPYQEFVDKNIPSLARSFKANGFATNAIQMVPYTGFGYDKIYEYIGVDNKISLSNQTHDSDPSGRSVAAHEVSHQIIELLVEQQKSFIFAFPNSSHQPWDISDYPDSKLRLLNSGLSPERADRVLAYANSLKHVDSIFGELIAHVQASGEKTLLLVVGDHQPGMEYYNNRPHFSGSKDKYVDRLLDRYRTSFAVWSNYHAFDGVDGIKSEISMNLIPAIIIRSTGIQVDGMMKFVLGLSQHFSVISHLFKSHHQPYSNQVEQDLEKLIDDYQMLQYDILFGDNFIYQTTIKDVTVHEQ